MTASVTTELKNTTAETSSRLGMAAMVPLLRHPGYRIAAAVAVEASEPIRSLPALRFTVDPESGCWVWTGGKCRDGYGRFQHGGRMHQAHRIAYEVLCAKIPVGFELDHLCRNPSCINPTHLEPVRHVENTRRGKVTKLSLAQVREMRRLSKQDKVSVADLAERFGISRSQVYAIVHYHSQREHGGNE